MSAKKMMFILAGALVSLAVTVPLSLVVLGGAQEKAENKYADRFLAMWKSIHDEKNGYFSPQGIPYHALETLIIEAPDYGHLTTSEAFSYWVWLEARYGQQTGDWSKLSGAWDMAEKNIIPTAKDQPTNRFYNPGKPAAYAPEQDSCAGYPVPMDMGVPVGDDPLANELKAAYNTSDIYGMHWLVDVDNWYGYGQRGDGRSKPSYINTFQRGPKESVWHTVPHPSWEAFNWGGRNGFLDLFIRDGNYSKQWRYTNAPDADARMIQATYWANVWAKDQKKENDVPRDKASKMGDYLRYAFFDKYFKKMGCRNPREAGAKGREGAHYLLSWYYAWGGAADPNAGWAFRIGCSHAHQGYQNPLTAWVLSQDPSFKTVSAKGQADWATSLERQLEFYRWLQSAEGGIAGGATNSWNGQYGNPPANTPTFHGLAYDWQPVYHDPPSNSWFGFQVWSMERVAEFFFATGDARAKAVLDRWVGWALGQTKLKNDGTFEVPMNLEWTGQPETWNAANPADNKNLHVKVADHGNDIGVASSLATTLLYYGAGTKRWGKEDAAPTTLALELLDRIWNKYRDDKGVSVPEERVDYKRIFEQEIYIPAGWQGKMANGDIIKSGVKFIDIRSKYRDDPEFARVKQTVDKGQNPSFRYHRFWAQAEFAIANATAAEFAGKK